MLQKIFGAKVPSYFEEELDILRLIRSENVGPRTFINLIKMFGNASKALDNIQDFARRGGRAKPIKVATKLEVEKEVETLHKVGAKFLTYKDSNYSELLLQIPDFPPVISYKGDKSLLKSKCIALVGARNASINGRSFAAAIAKDLAKNNITSVSGLARGIDTAVHNASFPKTIAVIAGGIDHIYPSENTKLFEQISEEGLVVAELPVGSVPLAKHFPQRNRIISGLSFGTVVIEAGLKSGSLITANFALEQGREVFAVPGFPLDPRAQGSNKLIKDGAYILQSCDDILESLPSYVTLVDNLREKQEKIFSPLEANYENITQSMRNKIIEGLSATPIELENLLEVVDLPMPIVYTILLELELAGRINRYPGGKVGLVY